jgi:hypothetical protein
MKASAGARVARCFSLGVGLSLALLASPSALGQHKHDPLTDAEIDQIRDASWEPQQRLGFYVKFARARLVALEQMRADPKTKDRALKTHDTLQDFLFIYDELNDNVDTYLDRKDDIRKPLKIVIEADTEFQAKLRALKDAADVPAEETRQYEFELTNTLDTVDSSAEDHRKTLADLEEDARHRKQAGKHSESKPE